MMELLGPIVAVAVALLFLAIVAYSVALQRKAVSKQAKAMAAVDESIAHQRAAMQLARESNEILNEILKTLREKDKA